MGDLIETLDQILSCEGALVGRLPRIRTMNVEDLPGIA
jgi:hypothetical protein